MSNKQRILVVMLALAMAANLGVEVRADAARPQSQKLQRKAGQSIRKFLQLNAPRGGNELVHFGRAPLKMGESEVLVGVYEGGFDAKGQPSSGENANRQFAFGFARKAGSQDPYVSFPIVGFFDDGGSPVNVLAVFTANFVAGSPSQLAFLTAWDSSMAGGHSVMEVQGMMYDVLAFDFDLSRGFTALKSSILGKLSGVDGESYDKEGTATKALKAKATSVVEVKARLRALGIPQTAD
jgi:hypothetical protein